VRTKLDGLIVQILGAIIDRLSDQRFGQLVHMFSDRLSDDGFSQFILRQIERRIAGLQAKQALKLLFALDTSLYGMQGQRAIEYDGGNHTKHRHMKYHDFFTQRIDKDDHGIDIGCGNGAVANDIAEVASRVVGIDIKEDSIALARQKYQHPRLDFRVGDALETLPDEKFSVVILSNLLEHLPDRPAFLRRIQETLRPKRLLIRVPLFERDWRVPLKHELGIEWRLDRTHEIEYTLDTFGAEMAAAGFNTEHLEVRWGEIWAQVSTG